MFQVVSYILNDGTSVAYSPQAGAITIESPVRKGQSFSRFVFTLEPLTKGGIRRFSSVGEMCQFLINKKPEELYALLRDNGAHTLVMPAYRPGNTPEMSFGTAKYQIEASRKGRAGLYQTRTYTSDAKGSIRSEVGSWPTIESFAIRLDGDPNLIEITLLDFRAALKVNYIHN